MKKKLSIFMLLVVLVATAFTTNANCPEGNGACTGVCVKIYNASGTVTSEKCDTGATAAAKDCTQSAAQYEFSVE